MKDIDASAPQCKGQAVDGAGIYPQAVVRDGETVPLDIAMMLRIGRKIGMDNFGRLSVQIARAAQAKRPSELQRLLLAIVTHKGEAGAS